MKKLVYVFYGLLIGVMGTYIVMKNSTGSRVEASHSIAYEIKRMNRMIVAEQHYSDVFSHKSSLSLPRLADYFSFDKKVLLLVDADVQAVYDLNRMDISVDSVNKTIYINKIPDVEIKIYPDVRFYDMEQSSFNTFDKDDLNQIKKSAVSRVEESIDKEKLKKEAHEQLIDNLGEIYLLARAYNWKLVDRTRFSEELSNRFR